MTPHECLISFFCIGIRNTELKAALLLIGEKCTFRWNNIKILGDCYFDTCCLSGRTKDDVPDVALGGRRCCPWGTSYRARRSSCERWGRLLCVLYEQRRLVERLLDLLLVVEAVDLAPGELAARDRCCYCRWWWSDRDRGDRVELERLGDCCRRADGALGGLLDSGGTDDSGQHVGRGCEDLRSWWELGE